MAKGMEIEISPLDEDHVRAKITGPSKMMAVENLLSKSLWMNLPKTKDQLKSDARALAARFARAFADKIEN